MTRFGPNVRLLSMRSEKILLIEDSSDLSFLYKKSLSILNCEIEICPSGLLALEKLAQSLPKMIIMDLTLGDISVEDFFSKFMAVEGISQVPLILISGREDVVNWANKFGATFVAKKPVDMTRFRKAVQEILAFDDEPATGDSVNSGAPTLI